MIKCVECQKEADRSVRTYIRSLKKVQAFNLCESCFYNFDPENEEDVLNLFDNSNEITFIESVSDDLYDTNRNNYVFLTVTTLSKYLDELKNEYETKVARVMRIVE